MSQLLPKPLSVSALKQRRLKALVCSARHERALRAQGFRAIAGVDEVGRGALFGPVVTAAVVLPQDRRTYTHLSALGLRDSKQVPRATRESLAAAIRACAVALSIAEIDAATIDRINIYQATRLAMLHAVQALACTPDHLLIDAMRIDHPCPQTRLIHGDALSLSIAAASIIAKVHRDQLLRELDPHHPHYGLASHKGYGTPGHLQALKLHGPCPMHRFSFEPVAQAHALHNNLQHNIPQRSLPLA